MKKIQTNGPMVK